MKVLFVNLVYGTGSTGKIIADIMNLLKKYGNDVKALYGTGACSDNADTVKVSGKLEYYFHNAVSRFTDHAGLYSWAATRKIIREIRAFQPDLIHLHTLHGFYVNYEMLFRFLKEANIPVVWTLHDCWTFTGHCTHFSQVKCVQWQTECRDCKLLYRYARRYLMECGLPKERTFVTGSPMAEVLHTNLDKIEASDVHNRLGLTKGQYILLSAHREENIDTDRNFVQLFTAVNAMAEKYDMPILYSCHPRSRKRLEATGFHLDSRVIAHEPLGFHDYNCLQMNAFAVVSDSGTLPEESSFFLSVGKPFPAISIRTSTERPEALDAGCFVLAGIDAEPLLQAVEMAVGMQRAECFGTPVADYTAENVSMKVARIIQSCTGIVNKMVWRKDG